MKFLVYGKQMAYTINMICHSDNPEKEFLKKYPFGSVIKIVKAGE